MMSSLRPLAASSRSILRSPSLARPLARAASFLTSPAPPEPAAEDRPDASTPKLYQQSPNHPKTWSLHQNPKPHAYDNARFEQVDLAFQPNPKSAMAMVAEDPIRLVNGRKAACDGGGGPLGHPKVYINLDKPGPKMCGYCGIRFEQAHHAH